jgi:hypothetical protein
MTVQESENNPLQTTTGKGGSAEKLSWQDQACAPEAVQPKCFGIRTLTSAISHAESGAYLLEQGLIATTPADPTTFTETNTPGGAITGAPVVIRTPVDTTFVVVVDSLDDVEHTPFTQLSERESLTLRSSKSAQAMRLSTPATSGPEYLFLT